MNYYKKANITLAAVFVFFGGAAILEHYNPNALAIRLIYFVAEAALVGGIADWFAVTAIFKKPLGWGYHTALIPRNREKLIEAVAAMVQTELLHMDLIRKKIERISFIEILLQYVEKKGGADYLTDIALFYIRRFAEKQEPAQLAKKLTLFLRLKAKEWPLAPRVRVLSEWAHKRGYVDQAVDWLAEGLLDKASEEETRQVFIKYFEEIKQEKVINGGAIFRKLMGFVEKSDAVNLDEAADALQVELLLTLRKLKDPNHPLRGTLKDMFLNKITELEQDSLVTDQIEQWKNDGLNDDLLENLLENVLRAGLGLAASSASSTGDKALVKTIHSLIAGSWARFLEKSDLQAKINSVIVDILCRVIQKEHDLIGSMVRETLAAYNDQDLNRFIEEKAGNDFQWIRINGSMIGGLVGLILFLFLEFVYSPFIMPALTALISRIAI